MFVRLRRNALWHRGNCPSTKPRPTAIAVEHLLAREAAVGVTDGDGRTALHYAVDPSRRLRSWLSGLMRFFPPDPLSIPRAAFGKSANTEAGTVVDRLIVFGADVNAGDAEGVTPLMLAAGHGDAALVERLLKAGARRDATDEQGKAAIDYATSSARGSEAAAAIRRLLAGDDGGSP